MVSFVIDDLAMSGTQRELLKAVEFLDEEGPKYGLYKNPRKGAVFNLCSETEAGFEPRLGITQGL